jgi:transcriptional regulator with PAS, ATPase and Fis domain
MDGFRLVVTAGPATGTSLRATGEVTVIGAHESCDLVLADETVSRFHCELRPDGSGGSGGSGGVVVRDLDSRNGTVLQGVQVLAARLESGSVLRLGESEVRFERGVDKVKLALSPNDRFELLVGRSTAMRRLFAVLEPAAASDATVLLVGETGTGKEAAAESIHRASARRDQPFVVVDCGAIPPDLLESELFGHERGAFTGAVARREGAFEAAAGGTIFLDEIGELGAALQPKLLRALERRQVKRVGGNAWTEVDVRIVAATNRDLRADVNSKQFRSDLYYRLAVVEARIPPLRERLDDLPLLVDRLLEGLGPVATAEPQRLREPEFLAQLERHAWPGNVRELRNYLERCLALRDAGPPGDSSAPPEPIVDASRTLREAREAWTRTFERRYLEDLLARHKGNVTAAARAAGVDRIYLYRLLWRHGLR